MAGESREAQRLAKEAWRLLFRVAELHMEEAGARLMAMGISPVMGHFLDELARMPPGPMSALVARMDVDPGWVTDVVDKLEQRGDVVRRPSPDDRRVKILEVTEKGRETWCQMDEAIAVVPPELLALPAEDLRALHKAVSKLAAAAGVDRPNV